MARTDECNMSFSMLSTVVFNLMICKWQVCMVEMGHNHTFCHDLHNHTDIEVRLV